MDTIKEIRKKYEIGFKIFSDVHEMSDIDIKKTLRSICGHDARCAEILDAQCNITRTIRNEKIISIEVSWYNILYIDAFGIKYMSGHNADRPIVEFNKHFTLGNDDDVSEKEEE